jgi:hypothetical protein
MLLVNNLMISILTGIFYGTFFNLCIMNVIVGSVVFALLYRPLVSLFRVKARRR